MIGGSGLTDLALITEIVLAAVVITAAVYDLAWRRIPNWLVATGIVAGFACNGLLCGLRGLGVAAAGFGLAFLIYLPLYVLRAMGAGDVKLMGAIGSLVGPANWFAIFFLSAILGGIVGLLIVVSRGRLRTTLMNLAYICKRLIYGMKPFEGRPDLDVGQEAAMRMPHGAVIAIASLLFLGMRLFLGVR